MSEISSDQKLRNPSLTLYAFHLRTDISKGVEQVASEASKLWEQLMGLGNTLKIPKLQSLHQKLICYQSPHYQPSAEDQLASGQQNLLSNGEDSLNFQLAYRINHGDMEFNGSLVPFRIHDTYAIDLTLSSPNPITLGQINYLNPQGLLMPPHIQASLGQTLLFYAEIDALYKDDRAIADASVAQLFHQQTKPEFVVEGKLLGSSIFEYDTLATDPTHQLHVLVWLNHHSLPSEVVEVSGHLLYLMLCRHKILYAYDQSRWCDRQAKQIYSKLDQEFVHKFTQIAQAPDHLQQFQIWLRKDLPSMAFEYDRYLRDLSDHLTTIQTNLENYQSQMAKLTRLLGNDLIFLKQFSDLTQNKFLRQIQVDREYLVPGQAIFQQLIETIRGLAELEQTESDRRLERTIQVLGVGLATGAIVGAGYSYTEKPLKPPFSTDTVHPFIAYLLWSFIATIVAGLSTYWLTQPGLWAGRLILRKPKRDGKVSEEGETVK